MPRMPELPITRHWTPVERSHDGVDPFFIDSGDWYRLVLLPETRSLAEFADAPCLFLLGEPALGKSTAIRQEAVRLRTALPPSNCVLRRNLAEVSSDGALDGLFADPTIRDWWGDETTLHLFLDSYDECLRRYPVLKPRLLAHLRNLPLGRLRLRIACRSGDFPGHLPGEVDELWRTTVPEEDDPVRVLRLEPLSRAAVRDWAAARGVDGEGFLREVDRRNARPFATRPVTLNGLLRGFAGDGLPVTEVELYAEACRELCTEPNPDRRREPDLTPEQLLAVAEWIAALTTLVGKDLVWLGAPADAPDGSLPVDVLVGGDDEAGGTRVAAVRRAVEEALERCALFAVQDASLVRWSQQTYREFLAARYFGRRLRDKTKALQFLEHPGRPGSTGRSVAPQLAEPAAWLAAMDEGVAAWIVEHDPAVLLRGRHHVFPSVRPSLASWLLEEESRGRAVNVRWSVEQARAALDHPGLSDQLRSVLDDRGAGEEGRSLACQLAGACGRGDLQDILVETALDDQKPLLVRWSAVVALGEVGSDWALARLRPLLNSIAGDASEDHRLRAQVLAAVWPAHLSTTEALDYLRERQIAAGDEYGTVMGGRFVARMEQDHLVEALGWISANAGRPDRGLEFLIGEIMSSAAARADVDAVRVVLAPAILGRLRHHYSVGNREQDVIEGLVRLPEQARRHLANDLVGLLEPSDEATWELADLLASLDLPFDAAVAGAKADDPGIGLFWERVLRRDPRTWTKPGSLDALREAAASARDGSAANRRLTALVDDAVAGAAERARASGTREEAGRTPRANRQRQVEGWLARAEIEPVGAWCHLGRELNLNEETKTWILDFDLAGTPGWREAPPERRRRIIDTALRFLQHLPAHPPADRLTDWVAVSGYQAAALIASEAPPDLDTLTAAEWRYWLPGLAETGSGTSNTQPLRDLVAVAYGRFPNDLRAELPTILRLDAVPPFAGTLLDAFDPLWDGALSDVLAGALEEGDLSGVAREEVLSALLRHGDRRAVDLALAWVVSVDEDRGRAVAASRRLLIHGGSEAVARLVETLATRPDLARDALEAVAPLDGPGDAPWSRLPERVLADLYLLAADLFPPDGDPEFRAGVHHQVEGREMVGRLRDRFLRWLADLGTWPALDELDQVIDRRPDLALPPAERRDAEQAALRRTWVPIDAPEAVLDAVADERRRIVRNSDQLLDLVLESLSRLQEDLTQHGAAADLWSEWNVANVLRFRPKGELSVSDYVRRFLDRDLRRCTIAANREVENKRDNETDILVQYIDRDDRGREVRRLAVVLEVKGNWHHEVLSAMESQLATRYLTHSETDRGLYLVAWFNCERWDPDHSARNTPAGHTLETLRSEMARQARSLTNDHRRVEAVVLDAALPAPAPRAGRNRTERARGGTGRLKATRGKPQGRGTP